MDSYSTSQQPDEGYSEHPLNTPNDLFASKTLDGGSVATSGLGRPIPRELSDLLTNHLSALPTDTKTWLALKLLDDLPTSIISEIYARLYPRLFIDFVRKLPAEICLKILGYLDPNSLIAVARTCQSWNDLVWDHRLWERLYFLEGWRAHTAELKAATEAANNALRSPVGSRRGLNRISSDDSAPRKRRMVAADEDDTVMSDVLTQEPQQMYGTQASSIFSGDSSTFGHTGTTTKLRDLRLGQEGKGKSKGKGKAVARSRSTSPNRVDVTAEASESRTISEAKSPLWQWDMSSQRYTPNWRHLYNMRRKLEANWEQGNYKHFQFPHPDHPEEGHDNECIYALQFNQDYLVSGSRDQTLRRWSMKTGRLMGKPLVGHTGSVLCLQFDSDPDEDIIASGSSDSDVIIWRFSTGEIIQKLTTAHRESVLNVRFDKRILVTCSKDKTIKVFNRRPMQADQDGIADMPIVRLMMKDYAESSPQAGPLILPPYTMVSVLSGHSAAVNSVQIIGREIVSASGDRNIKIWDWQTGSCLRTYVGHMKGVACVQYDGKRIVSGSSDHEVKVFCRATGVEVASLRGHTDLVRTVQAGFADLLDSTEDDVAEARRVDQQLFDAMEAGVIPSVMPRGRLGNAGSSRPEEMTSFGGKVPPGGGGGKYARIVSGSYDKSIIVWRRDKSGAWKPRLVLRYEHTPTILPPERRAAAATQTDGDAAEQQQQQQQQGAGPSTQNITNQILTAEPTGSTATMPPSSLALPPMTLHYGMHPLTHPPPDLLAGRRDQHGRQTLAPSVSHGIPSRASDPIAIGRMIDATVPQGPYVLSDTLGYHPEMLTMQENLQAAIAREPDQRVRAALRSAVNHHIVRQQLQAQRNRDQDFQQYARSIAGTSDTASTTAQDGSTRSAPRPDNWISGHLPRVRRMPAVSMHAALTDAASAPVAGPSQATLTAGAAQPAASQENVPPTTMTTTAQQIPAAGSAGQPLQPDAATGGVAPSQAVIQAEGGNASATRIYKLQFDARRIICCSQTSVIVGWDFCNGDPELEAAARFFATIE